MTGWGHQAEPGHSNRRPVGLGELAGSAHELLIRTRASHSDMEEEAQLSDDHEDGHAPEIADEHGSGQELGEEPEPRRPRDEAEDADRQSRGPRRRRGSDQRRR